MVSFFGKNKDKKKSEVAGEHEDETQTTQTTQQPRESILGTERATRDESPSTNANLNDGATSASNPPRGSSTSNSSISEYRKEGVSRYASSYVGCIDGRCQTCGLMKIACNCQHCHCCRRFLLTLSSRKHCRRCWRATCPKCSPHERTNEFLRGEISRTCKECAVPHALLYLTELAYSAYDTVAVADAAAGKGDASNACHNAQPLDTRPFRWGLYMLGCEMEPPRRCINPSCASPISYDHVCDKCKLPTVTLAFHELRHVEVADPTDTGTSSSSKATGVTAEAVEEAVRLEYDSVAAERTTAEEDDVFDAALPNDMEGELFASLQGNTWSSRKVLLSLVACAVSAESSAMPNIALAMTDLPAYARLLRPVHTTEFYSVFNAPGHVRLIAFNSGASNRSAIHQILGPRMTTREAWVGPALRQRKSVASLVSSAKAAQEQGLTDCVAKVSVRDGVVAYVAQNDILRRLGEVVDKMAKDGVDVVLCGHGVGGAVASYVSMTLLLESTADLRDRLMCVTFGAPLVANHAMTDLLSQNSLLSNFQHFVNASDMVPRIAYVESLLESGNTIGTASMVGRGEGMASAAEVREAVVMWVGKHEEPHGAASAQLRAGRDSFSFAGFARKMRNTNTLDAKDKKAKGGEAEKALSVAEDRVGDIFRTSREPFDNNIIRNVDAEMAPTLHDVDFQRFTTPAHRERQTTDPAAATTFLWHARGKYMCTDDPATAIGLLSDRTDLRVELQDHLLSAYNKAMVEYIYSIPAVQ